jgi:hypothetical protein
VPVHRLILGCLASGQNGATQSQIRYLIEWQRKNNFRQDLRSNSACGIRTGALKQTWKNNNDPQQG